MKVYGLVCNLPDNEGGIFAETESEFELREINQFTLSSLVLRHGYDFERPYLGHCGGTFEIIGVSEQKSVLLCDRCHLRIGFPSKTVSLKDLREVCETQT